MDECLKHQLKKDAAVYDIQLTDGMLGQFACYQELLLEWNQRMNLTAITDPAEILVKHFLDSLLLMKAVHVPHEAYVIDVGTGAGFPGIPLKIFRPDIHLTLLDSLNKRVAFLKEVSERLLQENLCLHGRAEEFARKREYRESYDLVTARAVAVLPVLAEYCLPFARIGGDFAAMKGPNVEQEWNQAERAVSLLGGRLGELWEFSLPNGNERSIVRIEKISHTSAKYPRHFAKIIKSPLF